MVFTELEEWLKNQENHDQRGRGKNDFLQTGKYEKTKLMALGISNPTLKKRANQFYKDHTKEKQLDGKTILDAVDDVMTTSNIYEFQLLSIYILEKYRKWMEDGDNASMVFTKVDQWINHIDYWAISDHLAINIFPHLPLLQNKYLDQLRSWLGSDQYWRRRSALTALLGHGRKNPTALDPILEFAEILLPEENYYIKKAIPWIIREGYRKHEELQERVQFFVEEHISRFSKTMLRETIRYLSEDAQIRLLELYDSR